LCALKHKRSDFENHCIVNEPLFTGSMVATQHCYWQQLKSIERVEFWPTIHNRNPSINCEKIGCSRSDPWEDSTCQIWRQSIQGELLGKLVKYKRFVTLNSSFFSQAGIEIRPFDEFW